MRNIRRIGPYVDFTEARAPSDSNLFVKLGVRETCFQQLSKYMLASTIAQYYGLVQDRLLSAVHFFEGIKRPLMHGDDKNVDKTVLVYSWRPEVDFEWEGSPFEGEVVERVPPQGRVFVVLVRPEVDPEEHLGVGKIFGSIEKWNWVKEDAALTGAPTELNDRYVRRVWSRAI
jgi:hypothetical protein